jgi:hypothetical protein
VEVERLILQLGRLRTVEDGDDVLASRIADGPLEFWGRAHGRSTISAQGAHGLLFDKIIQAQPHATIDAGSQASNVGCLFFLVRVVAASKAHTPTKPTG